MRSASSMKLMSSALVLTFLVYSQKGDVALSTADCNLHVPLVNRNGVAEKKLANREMLTSLKQHPGFLKSWQPERD